MTREQIVEKCRQLCADNLGIDPDKCQDAAEFDLDLGADSLDRIELGMRAEELFDIEIDISEMDHILRFGDMVDLIDAKVNAP